MEENVSGNVINFDWLIEQIRLNSHDGLKIFKEHYGKTIVSLARSYKNEEHFVADVENRVLIKVWRAACAFVKVKSPIGWICTITRNCAKDILKPDKNLPLKENLLATKDEMKKVDDDMAFHSYLAMLKEKEQHVLLLKFSLNYTFKEIAQDMKKPISTVSSIYERALKKLEKIVGDLKKVDW